MKNKDGYITLGIVSAISLAMLLISVDISHQSIMARENVGLYESARAVDILHLSCVSIARQKIATEDAGGTDKFLNGEIFWQLRDGVCRVEMVAETQDSLKIRIENNIETEIEKRTGGVLKWRRY